MSEEKIYVGRGKLVGKFNNLKLGIRVDKMVANEKGYCNIIVQEMRQPDEYGNTHTAYIDTWKPSGQQPQSRDEQPVSSQQSNDPLQEKDLPF